MFLLFSECIFFNVSKWQKKTTKAISHIASTKDSEFNKSLMMMMMQIVCCFDFLFRKNFIQSSTNIWNSKNWTVKVLIQAFYHLFMPKINCMEGVWKNQNDHIFPFNFKMWENRALMALTFDSFFQSAVWFDDSADTILFWFISMQFNGLRMRLPPSE